MKHLVKKFIRSQNVGQKVVDIISSVPYNEEAMTNLIKSDFDNHYAFIQTNENELIQAFPYKRNGKNYIIPEANPIVIYFECARRHIREIKSSNERLFSELEKICPEEFGKQAKDANANIMLNLFYSYYTLVSISASFLFNSIEAFINNIIPKDFTYSKESNKHTITYSKYQIQKEISFEEKIKNVVPQITNKSFCQDYSQKWDSIKKLKEFRDEIIHTKSYDKETPNIYINLYTTALNFDFETTLIHVKDYLNYYENNLIEECDCGKDF
ncbi:MAG: hypothetical protein JWN78_1482 [Bacteroidota bacterium]|nr:hypothetical protein [Bacteroidota bacterium]